MQCSRMGEATANLGIKMGDIHGMLTLAVLSMTSTMAFVLSTTCLSEFARGLATTLADANAARASLIESRIGFGVAIPLSVTSRRAAEIAVLRW